MKTVGLLAVVLIGPLFSCGPKDDPIKCMPDSVNNLDGIIYNGHITLCNAQGLGLLVYETGLCSLTVKSDTIIFVVFSTNPDFHYYYSDTLAYECVVWEEEARAFLLHEFSSNKEMGSIQETDGGMFLVMNDNQCPDSSSLYPKCDF